MEYDGLALVDAAVEPPEDALVLCSYACPRDRHGRERCVFVLAEEAGEDLGLFVVSCGQASLARSSSPVAVGPVGTVEIALRGVTRAQSRAISTASTGLEALPEAPGASGKRTRPGRHSGLAHTKRGRTEDGWQAGRGG